MLHLPGHAEKKRSVDDELDDLLEKMEECRDDPEKQELYKNYVDAYEKLYKARNERKSKIETVLGILGQTIFMVGWEERHVLRGGFKSVYQKFGK